MMCVGGVDLLSCNVEFRVSVSPDHSALTTQSQSRVDWQGGGMLPTQD